MSPRVLLPGLLLFLAAGCVIHGARNAPGIVKLSEPPKKLRCQETEQPEDPGERVITFSTGVLFGGGPGLGRTGGTQDIYALALETSIHYGSRSRSHRGDPPLLPLLTDRYYPKRSVALNLGWRLLEREEDGSAGIGPGYAELQLFAMDALFSGVAAGWAVDVGEKVHGPQFTLFSLGMLYARVVYLMDRGTDLIFGMQVKLPVTWIWSR
jgi:hypothetical protein